MLEAHKGIGMAASNHTAVEASPSGPPARRRPRRATVPDDFAVALAREPRAAAFFEKLTQEHRYDVLRRLHAVRRSDTRGKRIALIIAMLARREQTLAVNGSAV
mgnify:CR=1 FL=1